MQAAGHFPQPLVITVSVPKGGDKKTWTAENLASLLGLWGYDVVAIDSNAQHDLWSDVADLAERGITPRFDVVTHDPLDERGNQTPLPDLRANGHRQVIIYDTSQYLMLNASRWAWTNCHVMIQTVSPQMTQVRNYLTGLQFYQHLPGARGPFLIFPCGAKVLKNSSTQQDFEALLRVLEHQGAHVPKIGNRYFDQADMIPESELMSFQSTRWVFDEREYHGKIKRVSDDFIRRVVLNFVWVRAVIEAHYGYFPEPRLTPLVTDELFSGTFDRNGLLEALRAEHGRKQTGPQPAAA
jgi:hypothetical protein